MQKKRLVDKLVEECTENIDETRLVAITSLKSNVNTILAHCTLYYSQ